MKKIFFTQAVLTGFIVFGIFFKNNHYPFFCGFITGACIVLLLVVTIGRWQAKRAAAAIDARMDEEKQQRKEWDEFVKKQLIDQL